MSNDPIEANTGGTATADSQGLGEYAEVRYLNQGECTFARTDGGFLSLVMGEETHARVNVSRAFPLTFPTRYLSVRDKDGKEIGIIEDLLSFGSDTRRMIEDDLERRYFSPLIGAIVSLKDEFGYTYWDVETDRGPRRFTARGHESLINLKEGRILIVDVDGNRYEIPDYRVLDPSSFKLVDALV